MLSFGRLMVTLQPVGPLSVAVPPGHCAELNAPPLLLLTLNVNSWLGHLQRPPLQKFVRQSLAARQDLLSAQSPQVAPPQSTSVSVPFLTPSEHVGAWQTLATQTLLAQSLATVQPPPAPQPAHEPPQSMPVSAPFLTPSEHVAA